MSRMTLSPELTEALCNFCSSVDDMEVRVDLIDCIEDDYIDQDTEEPARVLDTLKALRSLKHDITDILKAMKMTEQ